MTTINVMIFSGDDIVSSRKAFLEHLERLRNNDFEVDRLNGKEVSEESLELLSAPTSLFGQKRAIAIENLLSGQKSKEKDKIIQIVSLLNCSIALWEGKDFSKTEQLKYSGFVFKNFKLPASMFHFLESLSPQKPDENLEKFRQAVETVDAGFLFLMLARQIRLLILTKDEKAILRQPPWQKAKLAKQASFFSQKQLSEIYERLLNIDYEQKTSGSPYSLQNQLELLLTEI